MVKNVFRTPYYKVRKLRDISGYVEHFGPRMVGFNTAAALGIVPENDDFPAKKGRPPRETWN